MISVMGYLQTRDSLQYADQSNKISQDSLKAVLEYNEKSLRPKLAFRYELSIGEDKGGFFAIKNVGQGPAEIIAIRATFEGRSIGTDARSLSSLGNSMGMTGYNLQVGETLAAGDSATLYMIPSRTLSKNQICSQDKARKAFFEKFKIEIDYRSVYDHTQTIDLKYTSSNVLNC